MTTVTGRIKRPGGDPPPVGTAVHFELVGNRGVRLPQAWNTVDDSIVMGRLTVQTDETGTYTADVAPNADLLPADTKWKRTVALSTSPDAFLLVDAVGGDERRMLSDPPGAIGSAAVDALAQRLPASVRRLAQPVMGMGAVSFQWDDVPASAFAAAAINDVRGQQVTFAVTRDLTDTSGFLTSAQVRELHERGHEIAAHGVQHDTGLPAMTAAQRAAEYEACLDWYPTIGVPRPSTWVYTWGGTQGRSDDADRELWLRVDRIMDTSGAYTAGAAVRRDQFGFGLRRQHAESGVPGSFERAKSLIRLAAHQPVVVAFYMHGLDGASGSLTTAQYTELCDLAVSLGVPAVTARDALPANRLLVDGGFEDPDTLGLWFNKTAGAGGSTVSIVDDAPAVGLPGSKSLLLHGVEGGDFGAAWVWQHVPVQSGVTYTLSGRYRTSPGAGANSAKIIWKNFDHKAVEIAGTAATTALPEATAWTRFTADQIPHAEAQSAEVHLFSDPSGVVGTADVWFDHLCLLPKAAGAFG